MNEWMNEWMHNASTDDKQQMIGRRYLNVVKRGDQAWRTVQSLSQWSIRDDLKVNNNNNNNSRISIPPSVVTSEAVEMI